MKVTFVRDALRNQPVDQMDCQVCVVGIFRGDPQKPISEALKPNLVRTMHPPVQRAHRGHVDSGSRDPAAQLRIDTLELSSSLAVPALPGLDASVPSRLRDSVRILLEALPRVIVLLVTSPLEEPLQNDDLLSQLRLALGDYQGNLLMAPDLDPIVAGIRAERDVSTEALRQQLRERFATWESRLQRLGPLCRELFMTGIFDAPQLSAETLYAWNLGKPTTLEIRERTGSGAPREAEQPARADMYSGARALQNRNGMRPGLPLFAPKPTNQGSGIQEQLERYWRSLLQGSISRLTGQDVAVCLWEGQWNALRRHGWRSSAAVATRTLASQTGAPATAQLERRKTALDSGMEYTESLESQLLKGFPGQLMVGAELARQIVPVHLLGDDNSCRFEGQMCLRAPAGFWPIPAVRSLKQIELNLRRIAERFVFQPANEQQALELSNAIRFALDDYLIQGVLLPLPSAPAMVRARASHRSDPEPGLIAEVEASLQPWCYSIKIKFHVQPGGVMMEAA